MKNAKKPDELDLDNVLEFPVTSNHEFKQTMQNHLNNLFNSYGKRRVLEYIMETQDLEVKQQDTTTAKRGFFGRVA